MKRVLSALLTVCVSLADVPAHGQVSLTSLGVPYTENFDTLSNTAGLTTANLTNGWLQAETGGGARDNELYAVGAGAANTGDTYSFGAAGSTERALGGLRSGTLIPVFGVQFVNNTGVIITDLDITYVGEMWRLGTAARTDRLDFQYSLDAISLAEGIWTDVAALDFSSPDTVTVGAKDGNFAAARTVVTSSIGGLAVANGAVVSIRWTDLDASGADDGLAVDEFRLTAIPEPSTYALLFGVVTLGLVIVRRRCRR